MFLRSGREIWLRFTPSCKIMGQRESTILPFESLQSLFRIARTPSPSPPASSSFSLCRAMCLSVKLLNYHPKALGFLSCVTRLGRTADLFSRNGHYIASMFHSRPCDSRCGMNLLASCRRGGLETWAMFTSFDEKGAQE